MDKTHENQGSTSADEAGDRNRSTIKFPYVDLNDAISVAKAIHDNAGNSCSRSQLGGFMGLSPSGGGFRLKVTGASSFGLVKSSQGNVILLDRGRDIVDPQKAKNAKVEAFLDIPLYEKVYKQYDGYNLPPKAALEKVIEDLGVSPKQSDKARQVLMRSAEQAGFFNVDQKRLVQPIIRTDEQIEGRDEEEEQDNPPADSGERGNPLPGMLGLHPFITGLLQELPKAKTEWDAESQANWLQTAAHVFKMIYKTNGGVTVEVKKDESKKDSTESATS